MKSEMEKSLEDFPLDSSPKPILLILLGASNLGRGHDALVRFLKRHLSNRKVDLISAMGAGRGYCAFGGIFTAVYSPIASCEWYPLAKKKVDQGFQIVCLMTDIGNDILYNKSPTEIKESIQSIIAKLKSLNSVIFYTTLPKAFENQLRNWFFVTVRSMLYPKSKVSAECVMNSVKEINKFLETLENKNVYKISSLDSFLGWDQVHYSLFKAPGAWTAIGRQILEKIRISSNRKIHLLDIIRSYQSNFFRWVIKDLLKLTKKNQENFY